MSNRKRKRKQPIGVDDVTIVDNAKVKKAIGAAALGNALEWFDFGVYGFLATLLGKIFFPGSSPSIQLIGALATFSVPFLVRPLGGVVFGIIGDKYGRQKVLSTTIILMTLSTAAIGLIPGYASIGIWAPILLLICKVIQGFSVGGEYTGAAIFVAEYSPDRRRGLMGSFLDFGSMAGFACGALFVLLLGNIFGEEAMHDWAWRIAFLIALPLGGIGLYLRYALEETPAFQASVENMESGDKEAIEDGPKVSFREIAVDFWKPLLLCIGMVIGQNVIYYTLLTYMPSYLQNPLNYSENTGLMIILAIMVALIIVQPLVGHLSDKFGRRPFMFLAGILLLILPIPAFNLITTADGNWWQLFSGLLLVAIILSSMTGITASTVPALFPTRVRYSALASAYNIAVLVAGLTPTILASLVAGLDNEFVPAYYLMLGSIIILVTAWYMRETANKPLRGDTPSASSREEAHELIKEHHDDIEERIAQIKEEIEELKIKRQETMDDMAEEIKELEAKREHLIHQHPRIND